MKINKDNYLMGALILLTLALIVSLFKKCEPKPIHKINLTPELIRQDSFRTVIKYHDSTRIKTIVNHRELVKTILKDSTKCYSEIIYVSESCEDVIAKDSILISSLYGQHKNDSIISLKKDSIIVQKSDSISTLSKKLKWQKRFTKGAFITGLLGGGYLGFKIKN